MTNPPEIPIRPIRRSIWERVSVVWLVPVAALLIALGVGWQSWTDRGPVIVITFDSASGVKARETVLRYRDVTVGIVEAVGFSPSLEQVEVTVRVDKDIAPYIDADAQFWVVRPEVSVQGVSGLDTVLSGVFIEGIWDTTANGLQRDHLGRKDAPLQRAGETGTIITLRASGETILSENTPLLYKGIEVGRTGKPHLSPDGAQVTTDAIVRAPYDTLINSATRFWDTSGFSFSLGANGAELDFTSLATLISGGLTFETIVSGGMPVTEGFTFDVYEDEETARASLFSDASAPGLQLAVVFRENISGLITHAPVEYGGVRVGEVTSLRGLVDEARFGDARVRLLVALEIKPERLGLDAAILPEEAMAFLADRVAEGLRARLATESILTGGLKVELLQVENAPPATLEAPVDGVPVLPTTANNVQDVAATAQGVLKRVNDLPIEEVMASTINFLDNASSLLNDKDVKSIPGQVNGLLSDARNVVGSEQVQKLPASVDALLVSLQATTEDLRATLAKLNEADAINRLLAAIDAVGAASEQAGNSVAGVPQLVDQLSGLTAKINSLPLDSLLKELEAVAASTSTLLASDGVKSLPDSLNAALAELQQTLAQLRDGGLIDNANKTLASTASAADAVAQATKDLPEIAARLNDLVNQANATLAGFGENSGVNRDVRGAMRKIQEAADAVASLARALERRPNSIIIGR